MKVEQIFLGIQQINYCPYMLTQATNPCNTYQNSELIKVQTSSPSEAITFDIHDSTITA